MDNAGVTVSAGRARVFLVEDHAVVREGLTLLIGGDPDMSVCGSTDSVRDALDKVRELKPDVAVVDIVLGDENGLDLIKSLHQHYPKMPILALSMHDENVYAERALRAGAKGYIMRQRGNQAIGP